MEQTSGVLCERATHSYYTRTAGVSTFSHGRALFKRCISF